MKVSAKRKPVTLRQEATRLGTAILTRQEARRRAAMAIRKVCGIETVEELERPLLRLSFGDPSDRPWRHGRRWR
jgi:hypothetical protein